MNAAAAGPAKQMEGEQEHHAGERGEGEPVVETVGEVTEEGEIEVEQTNIEVTTETTPDTVEEPTSLTEGEEGVESGSAESSGEEGVESESAEGSGEEGESGRVSAEISGEEEEEKARDSNEGSVGEELVREVGHSEENDEKEEEEEAMRGERTEQLEQEEEATDEDEGELLRGDDSSEEVEEENEEESEKIEEFEDEGSPDRSSDGSGEEESSSDMDNVESVRAVETVEQTEGVEQEEEVKSEAEQGLSEHAEDEQIYVEETMETEEIAAEVVSSSEQTSDSESGVPVTMTTDSDMSYSTQDISSMQSSIDNLDMSIIEHPGSSAVLGSPESSEGGAYAAESAGSASEVSIEAGESADESQIKDEGKNKEDRHLPPLDALHANVAANEGTLGLGAAAAPSTPLVERSSTPIHSPPLTLPKEAETTTQLPEPTTEETEITTPRSQSTLETSDEDQSQSIYDSGVLIPEHAEQTNTHPQSPHAELSESVVFVSHLDVHSSYTTGLAHDGSSDTTAHNLDYGITSIHSTHLELSESVDPGSSVENPSLSESLSMSELSTLDEEDLEEIEDEDEAEREWRESLKELELLASMVLVPFVGKWVGRRCAYWGKSTTSVNKQTSGEDLRYVK